MGTSTTRSADFLNTLGIDAADGAPNELSLLQYLGIHHVRQLVAGGASPTYIALAKAGIQFDTGTTYNGQDVATTIRPALANIDAMQTAVPGSIYSVEGPNEANDPNNNVTFNGASLSNPANAVAAQQALYNAVKADPILAGVKILTQSVSEGLSNWQSYIQGEGNLSAYADSANVHTYPNLGSQPGALIASDNAQNQAIVPGKAPTVTEIGYITDPNVSWSYVDPATQAKNVLNIYLDEAKAGGMSRWLLKLLWRRCPP